MQWKAQLRRTLDRLDNEEVRTARTLARRARHDRVDVLYLGESTAEWVAPDDVDRRPLWAMTADTFVDPKAFAPAYGGSYSTELHEAYVRLVLGIRRPKLIVSALWYRGRFLPWMRHPVYSRAAAAGRIAALDPSTPWWRIRAGFPAPRPDDWRRYHALPWTTFADLPTIGEYVGRLKDPGFAARDPEGRAKLIYAYHQTHRIPADGPELDSVRSYGAALRAAGCPVVVYETPVSVQTGRRHWGEAFDEVAAANFARLRAALIDGFGSDPGILEVGTSFPPTEFIDPAIADEHLNERGRARLAGLIADRVRALDPSLVKSGTS